jgi:S-adenosylmethionine decarboxylase
LTKPATSPSHLGRHLLAEFYDCNANVLNNVERIEDIMTEAAIKCGATVVQKGFHRFNPYGVSGVVIIAESHLAIHTWPELGYAAIDLFTCGDSCNPQIAYDYLIEELHAKTAFYSELNRGLVDPSSRELMAMPFQLHLQKETHADSVSHAAPEAHASQRTAV